MLFFTESKNKDVINVNEVLHMCLKKNTIGIAFVKRDISSCDTLDIFILYDSPEQADADLFRLKLFIKNKL